ncbi:MAG: nucleoside recognition domain-containing protein [Verrucomicrobiota bacterium]
MLNVVWLLFFVVAFLAASYQLLWHGNGQYFNDCVQAMFGSARAGFELALYLTAVMTLFLGILKCAEDAGLVRILSRAVTPLFKRLMPEVPEGHPAFSSITMNMAANFLGLGNAATPLGLKAMKDLQEVNPHTDKAVASNAQILFLVLNTSSVTLIPVTILAYRNELGSLNPTSVFIPIILATSCSTLIGLLVVAAVQRIKLWDPVVLAYLGSAAAVILGIAAYFSSLDEASLQTQSTIAANVMLFGLVVFFLVAAWVAKVPVYESFVEGGKEGFQIAVRIIPYLVGMLVAIGVFRASGVMDATLDLIASSVAYMGLDPRFVDGLPTALMRPFTGGGSSGLMVDTMTTHGPDSFAGNLSSIVFGSTETTFYVLAVYFGSVGVSKTRHAVPCGLAADAAGIVAAILLTYLFFPNAT